ARARVPGRGRPALRGPGLHRRARRFPGPCARGDDPMSTPIRFFVVAATVAISLAPALARAQFTYRPAGEIIARRSSSGDLVFAPVPSMSDHVFVPNMRFPIQEGPSFANSQVFGSGGLYHPTPDEGQCGRGNFSYPWRDTFCEGMHVGSGSN